MHSPTPNRTRWLQRFVVSCAASLMSLASWSAAAPAKAAPANTAPSAELPAIRAEGTRWVKADGSAVALRGVNLGTWLLPEFWMMAQGSHGIDDQCKLEAVLDKRFGRAERERLLKLFREQWITDRDWDLMPRFGLNLVRLPFIWSLVEDETKPRHLRPDAWHYLDSAIAKAEARGLYVILDLHGAVGGQGGEHHTGCAGQNHYWKRADYQERTAWLWDQVARRYKDRTAVAGYSVLNEPWGVEPAEMAARVKELYGVIRAADPNHTIILPEHYKGRENYGKLEDGPYTNVAIEMHFYPGFFGWGKPGAQVHRDWLTCKGKGGVCEWQERMARLNMPMFVGEFQPWAELGVELGGQITRATFDRYAELGWASALWAWKWVSPRGGLVPGNWGLVTNAEGQAVPALDFNTASLEDIEALFRRFGNVPYQPHTGVMRWMNSPAAPEPFKGLQ